MNIWYFVLVWSNSYSSHKDINRYWKLQWFVQVKLRHKQAEKLKSREMKEGWMKNDERWMENDERWMKNDDGWRMNDEGWWLQAVEGFCRLRDWQTNRQTDICECRVAFATENYNFLFLKGPMLILAMFWFLLKTTMRLNQMMKMMS